MDRHALVLIGGNPPFPDIDRVPPVDLVIAADSGLEVAQQLDVAVDLLIGDLDSVDPALLLEARRAGIPIDQHSPDKDASDLELALDAALRHDATSVTVVGGTGGRLDHELGNLLVLANSAFCSMEVTARLGRSTVAVVHSTRTVTVTGEPGDLVSVFATNGPAHGVDIVGLLYEVVGGTLRPGSSLGLSNELRGSTATIRVTEGTVLVVQPGSSGHLIEGAVPPRRVDT
jgi:thiamine pyrophosphokinase